ncbi:MAG TPA: heparan-alpha-glucosaminide N-acetyltransferase domain-containing protein [Vicinamibacteria bacterium]|nr:heparan-alpha-glucosaminide N-acetyltransferase domain-containing protein [Vicinamibacteria bacterium]
MGLPLPVGRGGPLDLVPELGLASLSPGPGTGSHAPHPPSSSGLRALPDSLGRGRELYIDAFRGLMALVMVQGHVTDVLLTATAVAQPWYVFQQVFHGSTAPGFLFASGYVAGLPRAPLSPRAGLRRARRLAFVLGVGYFLHLPYFSLWKTLGAASPAERAALLACDALQVIAATQLFVLVLQWVAGRHWTRWAGLLAVAVTAATPLVWSSGLSRRLPEALAPWLDESTGSRFPIFPFAAFVLAGTLAGTALGRAEPRTRHHREIVWGLGLVALGALLAWGLSGSVDFWGPSPAYVLVRLGGLLLLLRLVEAAARAEVAGTRALALLGHETLLVYVLHLYLLFGGVFGRSWLTPWHGQAGLAGALGVLVLMLPVLLAAAWLWRAAKQRAPQEARLALVFLTVTFLYEFAVRPW